jgi:hypothetical protein
LLKGLTHGCAKNVEASVHRQFSMLYGLELFAFTLACSPFNPAARFLSSIISNGRIGGYLLWPRDRVI